MEANGVVEVKQEKASPAATTAVTAVRELLRFPMQDPAWRNKFLVGSGLVFLNFVIPILPLLAVAGYCLKIMKQGVQGEQPALPEWEDWGELILEGLKGTVLGLLYLVPGYLVLFGGIMLVTFGQFLIFPLTGLLAASGDPEAFVATTLAVLGVSMGMVVLQIVLMAIGLIAILLGLLPLPLAVAHYSYLIGSATFGQHYRESRALWEKRVAEKPVNGMDVA